MFISPISDPTNNRCINPDSSLVQLELINYPTDCPFWSFGVRYIIFQ